MSGPPYPHPNPAPGSNAIGSFVIGVSPIGTISPFDFWSTVISQYANSPILTGIIESFNDAMDQTEDMDSFYDLVWNVATAQGWGLDVWGLIVGVSRVIPLAGTTTFFGYQEQSNSTDPYNVSPYYTGAGLTDSYALSDSAYRTLIYAKALANICDGSIPAINSLLLTLFPNRGSCYVTDGQDMTMTYTFEFALSQVELSIVQNSGVLPTPAGVSATIVQL